MAFQNSVVGQNGTLVRSSIHSPNYVTGISGWTINKDGSAEFSNLTIRGTFNGTDFIINSSGVFLYNGTPATGNLVGAWASAAGTDSFGNTYAQGLAVGPVLAAHFQFRPSTSVMDIYDSTDILVSELDAANAKLTFLQNSAVEFTQINGNSLKFGDLTTAGVLPTSTQVLDAAELLGNSGTIQLNSGVGSTLTDQAEMVVNSGNTSQTTGSAFAPMMVFSDSAGSSAADVYISGSLIKTTNGSVPYVWTAPTMAGSWVTGTGVGGNYPVLRWRYDGEDNIHVVGAFHSSNAAPGSTIATGFPPIVGANVSVGGAAQSVNAANRTFGWFVDTSGHMGITTLGTVAANDTFIVNAKIPIGNIT